MNIIRTITGFFQRTPHVPLKAERVFYIANGGPLDGEPMWIAGEQPIHGENLTHETNYAVHFYGFDRATQTWKHFDAMSLEAWRRFSCGGDCR